MTHLTHLEIYYNGLSDISPLEGLTNLSVVYFSGNNISDISPLEGLTNLTYLILYRNNVTDISPLVSNSGIGSGDTVHVNENLLDCNDAATLNDIATLEERGVILGHDCH